jgi:hypothetical protein
MTIEDKKKLVMNSIIDTNVVLFISDKVSGSGGILYKRAPYKINMFNQLETILKDGVDSEASKESSSHEHPRGMHSNIN